MGAHPAKFERERVRASMLLGWVRGLDGEKLRTIGTIGPMALEA